MKKNEDIKNSLFSDILTLLFHSILGIALTLLLSFICSIVVSAGKIHPNLIPLLSSFFVMFGSFFSSLISSRKFGKPLIIALVQCAVFLLMLYLIGAILYGRFSPSAQPMQIAAFCLIGALLGAIISALRKRRK